jgi:hypothetical protein
MRMHFLSLLGFINVLDVLDVLDVLVSVLVENNVLKLEIQFGTFNLVTFIGIFSW